VKLKSLKQSIIEPSSPKEMAFFAQGFLAQSKILNVYVESIKEENIEVSFAKNVVLKLLRQKYVEKEWGTLNLHLL
jgi:hypothetical protein